MPPHSIGQTTRSSARGPRRQPRAGLTTIAVQHALFGRRLDLVSGEQEIRVYMRLVAFEAAVQIGLVVDLPIRREDLIFPLAVTFLLRILSAPAGALFHDSVANKIGLDEAAVGILDWIAIRIELRSVED